MHRFQASVHNAALQAYTAPGRVEPKGRDLVLGTHANELGLDGQNRDRIAICVHTLLQYQLRGRAWLS
jgi:hypothetical protein